MSAPPAQIADILAQLRKEEETRTFARFDPLVLTRLALIQEWTDDLAGAVGLWTRATGRDSLDALQQADLVDRRPVLAPGGRHQEAFWVRARSRPSLASYLRATRPRIERDLDQLVKAIRDLDVNAFGLRAWLDVASVHRHDSTGLSLVTAVDKLVVAGQLADATDLVGAARVIGEVTGGPLADDSRRAGWRIERAYRADIDKEALRFYVNRADIEEALDQVIDPALPWALHLRGDGGVGKTMLVRYLASGRYARERGERPFPVARTDFDYLDPTYPEERPAELLLALAHELVSFADSREGYRFFRQFQDAANRLHEECGRPDSDRGAIEELQAEAIRQFAKVATEASGPAGDPVVLVLDTCEELAKLYQPGAHVPAPAIDRAFAMLTSLHDQAPAVRLLLAGRRRLTPADDELGRATGPRLLPRPDVRVLRVQGLSAREASEYIDLRIAARHDERPDAPPPNEALREAMLYRAREPGDDERYNPFVLASYCEWAYSDAPPDARELREAPGDPYVQLRIIGRITDDAVRQALPVAIEFGRFDAELIAPALARQGLDPEAAFAGLASQEWVRALTVTPRGGPGVVEVDEHLRGRIRAVLLETNAYTTGDPAQLGRDAADLIENRPLRTVPAEAVEAAVRLLPAAEAAVMWERLEAKTVAESAWSWADTVTARAGAVELDRAARSGSGSPTILGAILATQAAVRIHAGVSDDLAGLWQQVADAADRFPDPDGALRLKARAVLGRVAVGADVDEQIVESAGREADAGSLVAALDGPVGRGQRPPAALLRMAKEIAPDEPAAEAALLLAQATLSLWDGRLGSATHCADQALAAALRAERTEGGDPERGYADWRGPRRLADRCRLARLLIAWQHDEALSTELIQTWRQSVVEHRSDPDAQRLAALTIRFELGHHPVAAEVLRRLDTVLRPAKAVIWLHRQVRPLAVEVAEAWSVLGDPAQAASVLRFARDSAVELGDDPETIEMLQLAQLALCRRYRTDEYASSLLQLTGGGTAAVRAEAWLVLTLLTGERPSSPSEAGSWHGWWRSQDVRSLRDTSAPPPPEHDPGIGTLARAADRLEYQAVAGLTPGPRDAPEGLQLADEHGARLWFLTGRPGRPSLPDGAVGRAALAAGEVLALRLPEEAARLLHEAALRLAAAGDDVGAGQAHVLADLALLRAGQSVQGAEPPVLVRRGIDTMADAPQWEGWSALLAAWRAPDDAPPPVTGNPLPELDFRTSVAGADEPSAPRRRRWRYRWASIAAAAPAAGLAVFAALLPEDLAVVAVSAGVVAALAALFPLAFANLAPGYLVRCQAITIKPTSSGTVMLTARRHGGTREFRGGPDSLPARLTRLFLGGLRRLTWSAEWALGPPGPAETSGLRLPETRFPGGLALIALEVDPRLEPYPWERWIGQAASARIRRRLLFVRAVPGDTPSLPPRAWSRAPAVYLGPHTLTPPKPVIPAPAAGEGSGSQPRRRLLYLVGSPVPTAASWRMRVSTAASAETTESSRSVVTGEELVSMDSLGLSGTPLVVLQAEPLGGRPRALGDLEPGFRALAREAVDAGTRAVLVVPTLPDLSAADLVSTTWSRIASRRRPPPAHRLYAVAAKAKKLAWDASPPDGDQAVLDVLLFLRVPELEK